MRKVISFGKYAIGSTRKVNEITVEISLYEKENNKKRFSVCGSVWNGSHTDIIEGGQCLDSLKEYLGDNKKFMEIYRLWKEYHLNDLHAGTKEQEKFLNLHNIHEYDLACELLKENNLYEVEHEGKPYRYGSGWICEEIPTEDLNIIYELLK